MAAANPPRLLEEYAYALRCKAIGANDYADGIAMGDFTQEWGKSPTGEFAIVKRASKNLSSENHAIEPLRVGISPEL